MRVDIRPPLPATAPFSTNRDELEFSLPYMVLRAARSLRVPSRPLAPCAISAPLDNVPTAEGAHIGHSVTRQILLNYIPVVYRIPLKTLPTCLHTLVSARLCNAMITKANGFCLASFQESHRLSRGLALRCSSIAHCSRHNGYTYLTTILDR